IEFTNTANKKPLQRRLLVCCILVLLNIEGNIPCLRARPAHFVGNLPDDPSVERCFSCPPCPSFIRISALGPPEAASSSVNGWAAHFSRRLPTRRLKTC